MGDAPKCIWSVGGTGCTYSCFERERCQFARFKDSIAPAIRAAAIADVLAMLESAETRVAISRAVLATIATRIRTQERE